MEKILVKSPKEIDGLRVVQDYDELIEAISNKETVYHWEFGSSMSPMFPNKGYCRVQHSHKCDIKTGDAVLCVVNGNPMIHMVWQVSNMDETTPHFLIGSTSGSLYGWTTEVYGKAFATPYIEDIEDPIYED